MVKIDQIKSKVVESGDLALNADLIAFLTEKIKVHFTTPGLLLVHSHDAISLYKIENSSISEPETRLTSLLLANILQLRLFSGQGELYMWNTEPNFQWRLRMDAQESSPESHIYEEAHYIWGTNVAERENHFYLIEEHRGMQIQVPFPIRKDQIPLKYRVRNYFRYDEDGLIDFYDARLVNILDKNGGIIYG